MKIAICGTSPYSVRLAPYGDRTWKIWGCSPGLYPIAGRTDAWFELHRWEPPVLGDASRQVAWFTPEYCGWMAQRQHVVWMREKVAGIPNSAQIPWQDLVKKYGNFFFTSSIAWMMAMAIEAILVNRALKAEGDSRFEPPVENPDPENPEQKIAEEDMMGLWGVDMSTEEEYVQQRSGCQFFATLCASMGIKVIAPPESDLLMPPALYGISEGWPRAIRHRARMDMIKLRLDQSKADRDKVNLVVASLEGQLDAEQYNGRTWMHEGQIAGTRFEEIFAAPVLPPAPTSAAAQPPAENAEPQQALATDTVETLEQAILAGPTPPVRHPQRIALLQAAGLVRRCDPEWCRVKVGEKCICIAPIEAPSPPANFVPAKQSDRRAAKGKSRKKK